MSTGRAADDTFASHVNRELAGAANSRELQLLEAQPARWRSHLKHIARETDDTRQLNRIRARLRAAVAIEQRLEHQDIQELNDALDRLERFTQGLERQLADAHADLADREEQIGELANRLTAAQAEASQARARLRLALSAITDVQHQAQASLARLAQDLDEADRIIIYLASRTQLPYQVHGAISRFRDRLHADLLSQTPASAATPDRIMRPKEPTLT